MACASREIRAGNAHLGREPCSALERKSAAFALPITSPNAQANSNTIIGAMTSFIPSIHASIASVRSRMLWESTNPIETNQPIVDAQINAAIESLSPSMLTIVNGAVGSLSRNLRAPSMSMPPNVAKAMQPKGSKALIARCGTPAFGANGPSILSSAAAPSSSAAGAASAAASSSPAAAVVVVDEDGGRAGGALSGRG